MQRNLCLAVLLLLLYSCTVKKVYHQKAVLTEDFNQIRTFNAQNRSKIPGGDAHWSSNHSLLELAEAPVALIPFPKQVVWQPGVLKLNEIVIKSNSNATVLSALKRLFIANGVKLSNRISKNKVQVHVEIVKIPALKKEGYQLVVSKKGINIKALDSSGLYYGVQTLRQLMQNTSAGVAIPFCEISDWPAFAVRGFMHDNGRNFQSITLLKEQLELLSHYKYNTFQWHLTDNPAWRIESKIFPQLNEARFRQANRDPDSSYSFADIKELIRFAKEKHITIIPELDMPGHSAYFKRVFGFKMESEQGMHVLEKLIDEFCKEIPASDCPVLHIGSDEVHIPNPAAFIERMSNRVMANGRKVMVWNPGLPPVKGSIRQLWREEATGQVANTKRNPFIDSYGGYLNLFDAVTLIQRYFFQQVCNQARGDQYALGGILCCWPDTRVADKEKIFLHNPVWPGALAYSEAVWCGRPEANPDLLNVLPLKNTTANQYFAEFEKRLTVHQARFFEKLPFPYFNASQTEWQVSKIYWKGKPVTTDRLPQKIAGSVIRINQSLLADQAIDSLTQVDFSSNIFSEHDQNIQALIGFETPARSNRQSAGVPPNGKWDANGGEIFINNTELKGPVWENPGANQNLKPTWFTQANEIPYTDEEFFWSRKPATIQLKKGWNTVLIKVPKPITGQNWMFAFIPVKQKGGRWISDPTVVLQAEEK
ncbi:beta-N-acetylhexosaminidase [Pedobacter jeongneungensis]|uniref:beta-N-acetylhexosaminidase n=1 Tax=Pedobacter jeongneungensis TaxID=947309 RepID=UPI0031DCF49B